MLSGSIANSKLANSSITVGAGVSSTAISLGGTVNFGTSGEVDVSESSGTITYGLPDVTIANDLTISGNLTVSGTTTQSGATVTDSNFTGLTDANSGNATDFGFYGKYVESSTTKYLVYSTMHQQIIHLDYLQIHKQNLQQQLIQLQQDMQLQT